MKIIHKLKLSSEFYQIDKREINEVIEFIMLHFPKLKSVFEYIREIQIVRDKDKGWIYKGLWVKKWRIIKIYPFHHTEYNIKAEKFEAKWNTIPHEIYHAYQFMKALNTPLSSWVIEDQAEEFARIVYLTAIAEGRE